MTNTQQIYAAVAEVATETRIIKGIAIPYGETTENYGYPHQYAAGSFTDLPLVQIYYNHDHGSTPIGRVQAYEDTDSGLVVEAKIATTPKGEEVYTLLKEGVLDAFSVSVVPGESYSLDDGTVVYTSAELLEISVVNMPGFTGAKIAEVHSQQDTDIRSESKENGEAIEKTASLTEMEYDKEISDIRGELESFARDLSLVKEEGVNTAPATSQYNLGGDFLKALAAGDQKAKDEAKNYAYTGANTGDSVVKPAWVERGIRLVAVNRKAFDLFTHKTLPVTGLSIEYPLLSSASGSVGVQAAEGDDLVYNEIILTTATAPVKTYGGYTQISRQAIERSSVSYLETALDHLARNYGRATNAAVLAAATGASGVNTGTAIASLGSSTGAQWLNFVNEGVQAIEDNGFGATAEFMYVSRDVYNKITGLLDSTGRPLFAINGDGTNSLGTTGAATRIGFEIAGLPVVVDPALSARTAMIGAKEAVEIYENSGAPYDLSHDNIINLTKDFSLYGYMAIAVPNPKALFKSTITAA